MKLLIIILLVKCIYLFGDNFGYKFTKSQLRGMHKKELERIMQGWFTDTFNNIFDNILAYAKQGKNEYDFTIKCYDVNYHNCKTNDQYILIPPINPSYINTNKYTTNLINSLRNTFPDSNFTTDSKQCCEHYIIKW
jgi:hypothetical protein